MDITILGQGFSADNKNSVGKQLIKFLGQKDFHSFTGISAFASEAGINGLSKHILSAKKNFKKLNIIVGVNQRGTSKEALDALRKLPLNSFVFYHGRAPIFHPKIYLFEGDNISKLMIGSSNLTSRGLFSNIETSILVSINNSINSDRKIVDELKNYFKGVFDFSDPNLQKLTAKLIRELVKAKIVLTEDERNAEQAKTGTSEEKETVNLIAKIFPKREKAKIPGEFRISAKAKAKPKTKTTIKIGGKPFKLLWMSGALTERDLNIPKGSTTNPTGSMLFKKGNLEGVDQRHYFRDNVFSSLSWVTDTDERTAHLERATASVKIIVKGKDCGVHKLTITHNTRTYTASYKQKNSMTSISWGTAKKFISKDTLIGKNASMYKAGRKKDEFILIIE